MATVTVFPDIEALSAAAAEQVAGQMASAIDARGQAFLTLTGGQTPRRLYELLADGTRPWSARINWSRVYLFWSDERHVPPDHPDSNFGMANRALLRHVPIPATQIHRIPAEMPDPVAVATTYDETLRRAMTAAGRDATGPDLMLLGVGGDAHVASIFPDSPLLDRPEPSTRVAAVRAPHSDAWRITLTPSAILEAASILVLAAGAEKADAVHAALTAAPDPRRWPAQILRSGGDRVAWLLDTGAAGRKPSAG